MGREVPLQLETDSTRTPGSWGSNAVTPEGVLDGPHRVCHS